MTRVRLFLRWDIYASSEVTLIFHMFDFSGDNLQNIMIFLSVIISVIGD